MFFRNLKMKPGVTLEVTLAEVRLPVRLGHRDAEKSFIAPLSQQLAAIGMGTVTGFDARRQSEDEISGLDIYLGLTNASKPSLETVGQLLEHLRAPYGSSIRLTDAPGDPILFGVTEGLELSVDTSVTPDASARKDLAEACRDAIEDQAVSRGWTRKAGRTLFYFYGESFAKMQARLTTALKGNPRFSGAVIRRMA